MVLGLSKRVAIFQKGTRGMFSHIFGLTESSQIEREGYVGGINKAVEPTGSADGSSPKDSKRRRRRDSARGELQNASI